MSDYDMDLCSASPELVAHWKTVCEYIKENQLVQEISFRSWILPLRILGCDKDTIIFEYRDKLPFEFRKDSAKYIKYKYEARIVAAYNYCHGTDFKYIRVMY